jgi:hypothetical protein|uniref:Ribbon-helix-helix protein CopG domain-containing protein n=1 Tax=uncultured prokaryote TaxID=198431 RepID=A0A0H5QCM1_9ZZZZ|nr:unnamed protein product [uncultured bacterium]CRY93877.1 hypothetical protein [uncultured prokaryote]
MALKRVNMNIDEELLTQLDDYASKMHISRSSALAVLLSQMFQSQKAMQTMSDLVVAYNDEKSKGNV